MSASNAYLAGVEAGISKSAFFFKKRKDPAIERVKQRGKAIEKQVKPHVEHEHVKGRYFNAHHDYSKTIQEHPDARRLFGNAMDHHSQKMFGKDPTSGKMSNSEYMSAQRATHNHPAFQRLRKNLGLHEDYDKFDSHHQDMLKKHYPYIHKSMMEGRAKAHKTAAIISGMEKAAGILDFIPEGKKILKPYDQDIAGEGKAKERKPLQRFASKEAQGILPGYSGSMSAGISDVNKMTIGKGPPAPKIPKLKAPVMGVGGKPKQLKSPITPPTGVTPPSPTQVTMKSM